MHHPLYCGLKFPCSNFHVMHKGNFYSILCCPGRTPYHYFVCSSRPLKDWLGIITLLLLGEDAIVCPHFLFYCFCLVTHFLYHLCFPASLICHTCVLSSHSRVFMFRLLPRSSQFVLISNDKLFHSFPCASLFFVLFLTF